jgi:heat-inducible transcriptional repressor
MAARLDPRPAPLPGDARPALSDRQRRVLEALVEAFIAHGEPVSSLWLAERRPLGVSSATVRQTLAQLEALGYIWQPHTSAGRVPTDRGYRFYVDHLLAARRPAPPVPHIEARLRRAGTVEELLDHASRELSRVSRHVGFALGVTRDSTVVEHIDFVPLDARRVLVVVIAQGGEIGHKAVELDEPMRPIELQQAANYLNREFAGQTLAEVRRTIVARLEQERSLYDRLMGRALRLAESSLGNLVPPCRVFVQGAASLLDEGALGGARRPALDTLRALVRMIEEKDRLVRLLNRYLDAPGLTVVIGSEHRVPDLQPFSLVASTYADGPRTGTIGVIGPTRMRYPQAIAIVDRVSQTVRRVLQTVAGG